MNESTPHVATERSRTRTVLWIVGAAAVAFLVGFGWQWLEAQRLEGRLETVERELAFEQLGNTLAAAVIQASYGGYEAARELSSTFFTGLQNTIGQATPEERAEFEAMLARRDAVITALSRSDPASPNMLARMFARYQVATDDAGEGMPIPVPGSPTVGDSPAAADSPSTPPDTMR